jgi:ABC-type lipoprotein release transport system permease subunit
MKEMNVENLVATGKINIYPKKNTIDLKKHFAKKVNKIEKKTEKSIIHIAKQLMLDNSKQSLNHSN